MGAEYSRGARDHVALSPLNVNCYEGDAIE